MRKGKFSIFSLSLVNLRERKKMSMIFPIERKKLSVFFPSFLVMKKEIHSLFSFFPSSFMTTNPSLTSYFSCSFIRFRTVFSDVPMYSASSEVEISAPSSKLLYAVSSDCLRSFFFSSADFFLSPIFFFQGCSSNLISFKTPVLSYSWIG